METKALSSRVGAVAGTLVLAAAAVAFLAIGCGEQKTKTAVQRAEAPGATSGVMVAAAEKIPAIAGEATTTATEGAAETAEGNATPAADPGGTETLADALPPDVAASVTETIATPGGVVEILAEGSPDVTSVTLTDAVGKKYPFTYQAATDRWRVLYRIPIRIKTEQLGLSVTAANGANRWKRIWVFVDIGQGGECAAEADSGR